MAKRIIRLTESDIKRMVRQTIKEAYDQFSDEYFASDGDPYGLTTNKEPVGDFKVEDITVNGDMDVSQEFFSIYGQNFDSKYDFAAALNDYMQENFGTTVTDVDLASEFGDEGNDICINTDNRMPIAAHGGYTDMYESVKRTLREGWTGDINPRVMRGYQQELNSNGTEDCKRSIERLTDELRRYALAGNSSQV
jgi:hypothetical protein